MIAETVVYLVFGIIIFFAFGAAVGSFLNVVIYRFESGKNLSGRSFCPHCKHQLGVLDLIPIASYLFLSGKCRYCHSKISLQYPTVELITALAFTLAFISFSCDFYQTFVGSSLAFWFRFVYMLFFFSVLIVLTVFDFKKGIIPDKILFPSILIASLYLVLVSIFASNNAFTVMRILTIDLFATFCIAAFFLVLIIVTKGRGMGGGDFKLSIFIGLSLGWPLALVAVVLGFLTGAISAVMLILLGKKGFGQTIPFGPALAFGSFISAVCGDKILGLYLKTLGL